MTVHDSSPTPEPRALSAETTAALRAAVRRQLLEEEAPSPELVDAMRRAVAEARARGLRVEELIVAFKAILDAPAEGAPGDRMAELRLRERLVTLCIHAYFDHG